MNLLKSFFRSRRAATPGSGAPSQVTGHACVIEPEWHSQWLPDECGIHETRRHVGCSADGFHPGIEVCYRAGVGHIEWGEAQPTPETARVSSEQLENARRERISVCIHEHSTASASVCCVCSKTDAGVEMALLQLREIVAMIANDPVQNWPRYNPEFERAVAELQQSIIGLWVRRGQATEHRGGQR